MKLVFYDIGSAGSIPLSWKRKLLRLNSEVYCFDENKDKDTNKKLKNFKIRFINKILDKKDGIRSFYILNTHTGSSFYKLNLKLKNYFTTSYHKLKKKIFVKTYCLKNLVDKKIINTSDVIKIDTQGSELEILKGYGEYIDTTIAIETEVEFAEIYKDQPLFSDVDNFLRKKNFELINIKLAEIFHTDQKTENFFKLKYGGMDNNYDWIGKTYAGDVLYVRDIDWVKKQKINTILKYFEILFIYKFLDRAFFSLEILKKERIISEKQFFSLQSILRKNNRKNFILVFKNKIFRLVVSYYSFIVYVFKKLIK